MSELKQNISGLNIEVFHMKLDFNKLLIVLARNNKALVDLLECVSQQTINNIKSGKKTQTKTIYKITQYLSCDVTELINVQPTQN